MLRADGAKLILIELKIEQQGPAVYFPILEFHPDDVDANDIYALYVVKISFQNISARVALPHNLPPSRISHLVHKVGQCNG